MKNNIGERWNFVDMPAQLSIPKPYAHQAIIDFDQFDNDQKKTLLGIKEKIESIIGSTNIIIFGSRVNGNWTDKSDYDLIVLGNIDIASQKKIRLLDYGVTTDFKFWNVLIDDVVTDGYVKF